MKKLLIIFIFFLFYTSIFSQTSYWRMTFFDDFLETKLSSNWSDCPRYSSDWNKYIKNTPQTVEVSNGILYLRAIINPEPMIDYVPYWTGAVKTQKKVNMKYGKIEVKARFIQGQGAWPAIWMMPEDGSAGWPACGEIDIMEHLNNDNIIYQTIHSNYATTLGIKNNPINYKTIPFNVNEFNVYGLEWYPDRLDFTLNGNVTFTYPRITTDKEGQWPFNKSFYLILNQAAGGSWAGAVKPEDMPFEMQVDWVKMYARDEQFDYINPGWLGKYQHDNNFYNNTYVKQITSTGIQNPIQYIVNERPASYYQLYPDTLRVKTGTGFTINLKGFSLGDYSETTILQDLRYTCAYSFSDFSQSKLFELTQPRIGSMPPKNSIGGNMDVFDVSFNYTAPYVTKDTYKRVRIIFDNAWKDRFSAELPVYEGLVYDFNVKILANKTGLQQSSFKPIIFRQKDKLVIKSDENNLTIQIFDFTGKLITTHKSDFNETTLKISEKNHLIIRITNRQGESFSAKI